jgi:hypothetical protein
MGNHSVIFKLLEPTHGLPSGRAKADQVTTVVLLGVAIK